MNEFINICEAALDQGIDFAQANVHAGAELPMMPYHMEYLGEKLACIYGNSIKGDNAKAFMRAIR